MFSPRHLLLRQTSGWIFALTLVLLTGCDSGGPDRENASPTAKADSFSVSENTTLAVEAPGVLENDSDPDGDTLRVRTSPASGPAEGTLTLEADGSFEYVPEQDFTGEDSFTYEAVDGKGGTQQAQVVLLVEAAVAETFRVTVEEKSTEHPYYGEGDDDGYVIDGTQGKKLMLERDSTYKFEIGSGIGDTHPFYISTDEVGAGAGAYSDGVQNNGATEGETLTFTPPSNAPDSLWYQCESHPKMGWKIDITGGGGSGF